MGKTLLIARHLLLSTLNQHSGQFSPVIIRPFFFSSLVLKLSNWIIIIAIGIGNGEKEFCPQKVKTKRPFFVCVFCLSLSFSTNDHWRWLHEIPLRAVNENPSFSFENSDWYGEKNRSHAAHTKQQFQLRLRIFILPVTYIINWY